MTPSGSRLTSGNSITRALLARLRTSNRTGQGAGRHCGPRVICSLQAHRVIRLGRRSCGDGNGLQFIEPVVRVTPCGVHRLSKPPHKGAGAGRFVAGS